MSTLALGVCLALAAWPDTTPRFIATDHFTLAWTHSIEKTRWEEDYQVLPPQAPNQSAQLLAKQARIRGSAAGMEPPPEATLKDGWYHYQPTQPPTRRLPLMRSTFVEDYELCMTGHCAPMQEFLPSDGDITFLSACQMPHPP